MLILAAFFQPSAVQHLAARSIASRLKGMAFAKLSEGSTIENRVSFTP